MIFVCIFLVAYALRQLLLLFCAGFALISKRQTSEYCQRLKVSSLIFWILWQILWGAIPPLLVHIFSSLSVWLMAKIVYSRIWGRSLYLEWVKKFWHIANISVVGLDIHTRVHQPTSGLTTKLRESTNIQEGLCLQLLLNIETIQSPDSLTHE